MTATRSARRFPHLLITVCSVLVVTIASPTASIASQSGPVLGSLLWEAATAGPVRSTPAVADGVVYVGSTDGGLYALDLATGGVRWRYDAGSPVSSSPTLASDLVYIRDRDGALHAIRRSDGSRAWIAPTGPEPDLPWGYEGWDYVLPAATIADELVLFPGADGTLYAFERATGREIWAFETRVRLRATPTIDSGVVFFGDGDGRFHALSLADGSELWSFATDGLGSDAEAAGFDRRQIYSRAAVDRGVVYFGSRDAQLYALDAATGALLWRSDDGTSGWVIGGPAVADGLVFETRSSSTRIRAVQSRDGREAWSVVTGGAIFGTPLLAGGQVIVGNGSGLLLAFDTATGDELWRHGLGAAIWAEPAVVGQTLVVGADDGVVRAFAMREGSAARMAVFWDDELRDRAILGAQPAHAAVADYFTHRGYSRLDEAALGEFLRARVGDRAPSVVVFAMDALPPTLVADDLMDRYLAVGGRVVWLGQPPLLYARNEEGQITGLDRAATSALLGVDHSAFVGDQMPVFPTPAGRARGLVSFWRGSPTIVPDADTIVLAADELGRAVAWLRSEGDDGAGSFVQLYSTISTQHLDEIRRVVEHGIFRSPATREIVAH